MDDMLLVRKSHAELVHTNLFQEGGLRGALVERAFYAAVRAKTLSIRPSHSRSLRVACGVENRHSELPRPMPMRPARAAWVFAPLGAVRILRTERFVWPSQSPAGQPATNVIHATTLTTPPYSHAIQTTR
jgi:hypothetical protein